MKGFSQTIILGNLGADPEVRYSANGNAVCTLSVATNSKDADGNEYVEWHKCILFKRSAEVAGEYLRKGSQVFLKGENRTRKWQDKDGQDKYTTEVICHLMQMIGGKETPPNEQPPAASGAAGDGVDDIPFMRLQDEYCY